jgi:MFS family permease
MMHYKWVCQIQFKVTNMSGASAIPQRGNIDFILILLANGILSAAMPMLIVLGGLAGLMLAPTPIFSTLPASIQMFAGLLAAAPMAWCMGKFGRKLGFLLGATLAALGALMCGAAMIYEQFWLLLIGHMCLGSALACFLYFRFAAAEVVSEAWQPVAISLVLSSGLFAAFIGPEIFIQTKDLFSPIPFAGAYFSIIALSVVGGIPVLLTRFVNVEATNQDDVKSVSIGKVLSRKPVGLAVAAASVSGGIMILLMTPTPLAMVACGFTDTNASDVIRWHVIAMFAPSFVTGLIIKRFGVVNVILTGLLLLAVAAGLAISSIEIHHFYASLITLGIGWNFSFIGATSLLAASLKPHERTKMQGVNDTCVALAFTIASFSSGVIVTSFSWTVVAISALPILAIMMFGLMLLRKEV